MKNLFPALLLPLALLATGQPTFAQHPAATSTARATTRTITSTDPNFNIVVFGGAITGGPTTGLTFTNGPVGTGIGTNRFIVSGAAANTYGGATTVDNATMFLQKTGGAVAVPADLTIQNGGFVTNSNSTGGQLAPATNLTVNTNGTFDATGGFSSSASETFNGLNGDGTGTVTFGNQFKATTLTVNRGTFNGLLQDGFLESDLAARSGTPAAAPAAVSPFGTTGGALNKVSAGTLTLTQNNTYSGGTLVTAGALFANNVPSRRPAAGGDSATGSGDLLVLDGARLGGSGSVGRAPVQGEGTIPGSDTVIGGTLGGRGFAPPGPDLAPNVIVNPAILGAGAVGANSTAILTVNGNLTLTSTALLETELGGTTAGAGYDQVRVGGAIALGGNLSLATINGFALTVGQTFYILDGLGDPANGGGLSGTFANVSNAGIYTDAAGNIFRVNYADSDPNDPSATAGNDVSVSVLAVPEPGSLVLATLGGLTALGAWVRRRRTT